MASCFSLIIVFFVYNIIAKIVAIAPVVIAAAVVKSCHITELLVLLRIYHSIISNIINIINCYSTRLHGYC